MKSTTNRLSFMAILIIVLLFAYLVFMAVGLGDPDDIHLQTTEPKIVQSYTVTRGGRSTVIVEVWEMEYKGEKLRSMHFENTGTANSLSDIRFMLRELEQDIYEYKTRED